MNECRGDLWIMDSDAWSPKVIRSELHWFCLSGPPVCLALRCSVKVYWEWLYVHYISSVLSTLAGNGSKAIRAEVVGMAEYLPLLLTEPEVPENSQWRVLEDVSKKISGRRGVYNQTKVWNSGLWPWRSFERSQGPSYALWAGVRRKMEEREEDVRNWEVSAYIKGKGWDKV